MRYTYNHSKRLKESSKNVIDLNTATTAQMEEFLADNNLDIEIVRAYSDDFNRLVIKQSRKMSMVDIFGDVYYMPGDMDYGDLAIFKDGKLVLLTSRTMLSDYGFKADRAWWDAWIKDSSFKNRKHIILKFLIKYYYELV